MDEFFKTSNCTMQVHCSLCRNFDEGRKWRKELKKSYSIPTIDFECPKGKQWIKKVEPFQYYGEEPDNSPLSLPILPNIPKIQKPPKKSGCCGRNKK